MPWALAIPGLVLAPGFWAGFYAARERRLAQAAFVIGVLGVLLNVVSYAEVFI